MQSSSRFGGLGILGLLGAALAGSFSAPEVPIRAIRNTQTFAPAGRRKIRADKEGLPRFYPGAKLARKAAQGKLTLRG